MDRLTKMENGYAYFLYCFELCGGEPIGCETCTFIDEVCSRLAHYEDLEEQGRLVELPCKLRDTVWYIDGHKKIEKYTVTNYGVICSGVGWLGILNNTVFLTREEAEAKLLELEGGSDG